MFMFSVIKPQKYTYEILVPVAFQMAPLMYQSFYLIMSKPLKQGLYLMISQTANEK